MTCTTVITYLHPRAPPPRARNTHTCYTQALVQLPSVSIAKATMRHFEEDEEAKIGNKKIYINYSRSKSIEPREGDSSGAGGSGGSGAGGSSGGGSGGGSSSNGGHMSVLDLGRGGVGGLDMSRGGMVMMGAGGGGAGGPRGGGVGLGLGLGQAGVLGGVDGNGKGGSVQQVRVRCSTFLVECSAVCFRNFRVLFVCGVCCVYLHCVHVCMIEEV